MKRNILNLTGVKKLSKSDQTSINGGTSGVVCSSHAHCQWLFEPGWICQRESFFSNKGVCVPA